MLNKKVLFAAAVAMAFSACGKGDYNGHYSGTEMMNQYGMSSSNSVSLDLRQNGDMVTGTYNAGSSQGTLTANVSNAGKLDNVQLTVTAGYQQPQQNTTGWTNTMGGMMGCSGLFSGSLIASDDSSDISGSLNLAGSTDNTQTQNGGVYSPYMGGYGGNCTNASKTLQLRKDGSK